MMGEGLDFWLKVPAHNLSSWDLTTEKLQQRQGLVLDRPI